MTSRTNPPKPNVASDERRKAAVARPVGPRRLADLVASLSERDVATLRSLQALHYATVRQIERLHFRGNLTPLSAQRQARGTMARLHDLGLVDRLERTIGGRRAGSSGLVWTLSGIGAKAVEESSRRRFHEPSRSHLDHVLAVGEIVVQLHESERQGGIDLLKVETEPACWRTFLRSNGARSWLKPDLRLTIGVGRYELHWFVELDRATEHRPALVRKNLAYVSAWRGGGEAARAGVFPRVLWIVPDQPRADVVKDTYGRLHDAPSDLFQVALYGNAIKALTAPPLAA